MTSLLKIARLPRAFDPELGRETIQKLPDLNADHVPLVAGMAGSSPYLKSIAEREADWLPEALLNPEQAFSDLLSETHAIAPDQLSFGLRQGKRRLALLTGLADLAGHWSLEQVTTALTQYAELAVDVALKGELAKLVRRGKLPGMGPDDLETACGLSVFAMGKMGAYELNYSSDIDLICLFDETRYDPADFQEARQFLVRATRNLCALLSDKTADGYVFRTDLRLRPDPAVTPVCLAMEAAERYYESLGRTWERAAFIKARACAGDIAAGERFLKTLRPFVWRRHLDFAAIQDAHDMRLRIRENKGTGGAISLPGHDMKLGRGGIREIEFFTQTRQLIAGGRDPYLRLRGTKEGLQALAARGWVPQDVADTLSEHYGAHREVEHRVQMVHDAQTHDLPKSDEGFERLACLMGRDVQEMRDDIHRRLENVHTMTEGFFAPGSSARAQVELPEDLDASILARWPSYPALRSARGAQIFEQLKPDLLSRIARMAKPNEALRSLDGFLSGLPAGVQLFSLLKANPQLVDLLMDVVGTSPALAEHLSQNSAVFDAVIGGDFFADWPGQDWLREDLSARLGAEADYEARLDAARRWLKEWHFRIGVHHLRGLISAKQAGRSYADLADAVIQSIVPYVVGQFATKHGPPPGRGFAILGMGSLGSQRLNATSDLDLIVIYDPADQDISEGKRPLLARPYYARLTQALVTALTAPMSQGRLYEVDMRLRPSGTQGPVATSWSSFTQYQENEAWVWEHLALTRARVIAGEDTLARDIEHFRADFLSRPQDSAKVFREVAEMRERLAAAKTPFGIWDAKTGAGRLMDIELMAQAGALLSGNGARDANGGLEGAVAAGGLEVADGQTLSQAYDLYWSVQAATRLLSVKPIERADLGEGGVAFLCRSAGTETLDAAETRLASAYDACRDLIDATMKRGE